MLLILAPSVCARKGMLLILAIYSYKVWKGVVFRNDLAED